MKTTQTFGKIKIVKAKDSPSFKDRGTGFVAITQHGSEYYAKTQKQAIARLIKVNGASAI